MTELKHKDPGTQPFDRDLNLKGILGFSLGVLGAIGLALAAMWYASVALRDERVSSDPAPSIIPEAREDYEPPGPRLQNDPEAELDVLRGEEEQVLMTYRWVDEAAGVAQIPVERAMEILVAEAQEPRAVEPAAAPEGGDTGATATGEGAE